MLFTWTFWSDAVQRGLRTFAQTLVAALGGGALNIWQVGWHSAVGVAAGSALLAVLMAVDRSGSTVVEQPVVIEPIEPTSFVTPMGRSARGTGCGDDLR